MLSPWQLSDSCFTVSIIFAFFLEAIKNIVWPLNGIVLCSKRTTIFRMLVEIWRAFTIFRAFLLLDACFCIWQISIHILHLNLNAELGYFVMSGFLFVISMLVLKIICRCKWKYSTSKKDSFLLGKWNLKFNCHYLYFPTKNSENKYLLPWIW